jgi:hypothetical protein
MADGRIDLRMRCPECCPPGLAFINTGGAIEFDGVRAFGPAFKRVLARLNTYYAQALANGGWHMCLECGHPVAVKVIRSADLPFPVPETYRAHFSVMYFCPACRTTSDAMAAAVVFTHPAAEAFRVQHPRWIAEPEIALEYAGTAAIRFRITDIASAARLTIFAQRDSLHVLGTIPE